MKRLLFLLLLFPVLATAQPVGLNPEVGDSVGTTLRLFRGRALWSPFAATTWRVPAVTIPSIPGAVLYLMKGARTADTLVVEQYIQTTRPDTSWVPVPYLNVLTGQIDTTGYVILDRPVRKIQIYDTTPGMVVRIRTRTLRPSAERAYYMVK